ncbi:hypothetical protein [Paenibacillus tengchongensis]|uniref:hypothetical protein n=1 Tax=Paenibacillus tengchongensis TaxID=2608684 RepID=UPI00124DCEC1|nr:hypothetical protein [Paenibacillus tengchongensis]
METKVKQYFKLKAKQKELEQELAELRRDIVAYCQEKEQQETVIGGYRVKLVTQQRKEYDDDKLYSALPDPEVWRLLSKTDPAKVTALAKLNVIPEAAIAHTYELKTVTLLHVDKE